MNDKIQFNVEMSSELAEKLQDLSNRSRFSMGEVIYRGMFLMDVFLNSVQGGYRLAVVNEAGETVRNIIL